MKIFLFISVTVFTVFCCHAFSQIEAEKLLRFEDVKDQATNRVVGSYTIDKASNNLVENSEIKATINKKG
ncbi:hypothetical protein L3081_12015 [Colwellia sp. MSW7]|jgi:hypothetical protein|uniref:Uncharacterized protein n=1 Tax=Colwellia maritima TaxID=2912588 RepID=A0ABS9X1A6_9GAMM|nr:hypothetical protein [Colwellia maritima]MCI2283999.1 hypothetical protein [Colwellia maritima]